MQKTDRHGSLPTNQPTGIAKTIFDNTGMIVSSTNGLQNLLHYCFEYRASLTYVMFKQGGYDHPRVLSDT